MKKQKDIDGASRKKPIWKRTWVRVVAIVLVVCVALGIWIGNSVKKAMQTFGNQAQMTATVSRGEVKASITGSGTVEPYERYDITPMVEGDILQSNYNEGDYVEKDALLYEIEHEDMDISLTKARNSIEKTQLANKTNQENLGKLKVYAEGSGILKDFDIKAGDQVQANNKVGTIEDNTRLIAKVPFTGSQNESIAIGQEATVNIEQFMSSVKGTVTGKASYAKAGSDGSVLYDVEITLDNPGAISSGTKVTAVIDAYGTRLESPGAGTLELPQASSVKSEVGGKVQTVYAKKDTWVNEGDLLFAIDGSDLRDAVSKANLDMSDQQLSYESELKKLDEYYIKSPISGTVITKNYKAGDTLAKSTSTSNVLMTVADMSKMKFTFDTDELDIAKVALGQQVDVTADALTGQRFTGVVTKIASEGTAQNGVTTYPVEVTIEQPGELKPGMNVNAEIIFDSRSDVLNVPASAIVTEKGKSYVYLKSGETGKTGEKSGDKAQKSDSGVPAGTQKVEVTIGLSSENSVEIISGLKEGDEVILNEKSSGFGAFMGMGGMNGNMAVQMDAPPSGGGGNGGGNRGGR